MTDELIVKDSLGNILRKEKASKYDWAINESVFLLNIASKIEPTYISKELGILIRNLSKEEIEYCYTKISEQIKKSMQIGYDKIVEYENVYDENTGEFINMQKFVQKAIDYDFDKIKNIFNYIYSKQMYLYRKLDEKLEISEKEIFKNIDEYSDKVAKEISSNFIVIEIKDYKRLYALFNKYYSLSNDIVRLNWSVKKFINDFVKFMNVIFLESDSHVEETNCNFLICEFEDFDFEIIEFASFYDGYYHNLYKDKNISNNLKKINSDYIDSYIEKNNQNLNNLLFIVSRMLIEDDKAHEFNYREYNLNLITILELLLVSSKSENDISNKFVKNIMICLSINNPDMDFVNERKILKGIYRYRSCILHGNYSGYTNAMSDLEGLLEYKQQDYELNKYNTIDYLISKKLNFYVSNVFKVISKNKYIIEIIKN